jgi:L-aminopeptidase/D-esterase-like protein
MGCQRRLFRGQSEGLLNSRRDDRDETCVLNNLLTDIAGVRVGHADDAALASGVTAVIFDTPAVASMDVRGGGPGIREGSLLDPVNVVEGIDAIALSGGSAFGLEAGGGVQAWLAEQGRGFRIRNAVVPIVPGAICSIS